MRYGLLNLLLFVIPIAFLAMAFGPTHFDEEPFDWQPFVLKTVPEHLSKNRNVIVLVKSVYGGFSNEWHEKFSSHRELKNLVETGLLIPMEMEFAYVTPAPAGLESEYKWVYEQDTYIKSTFFVLHLRDGTTKIYSWFVEPETVVSDLRGWGRRRINLMLAIASLAILAGRWVYQIRRRPRITG